MLNIQTTLLSFYEKVLTEDNVTIVARELERLAPQVLGCVYARIELEGRDEACHSEETHPCRIPLIAADGRQVATLALDRPPQLEQPLFVKMAAWAIRRTSLLRIAKEQNEIVRSLRLARTIVEEALPEKTLTTKSWEISGSLKPAFHVGGDTYAYRIRDDSLCFLLVDAVGHGLGSTILASECRSLWRGGVAFEPDLEKAVARLNRLLYEDTGPERFVAATIGDCRGDGCLEYITCGQSPLFLLRNTGEVELLEACEPPLGLFPDLGFRSQRVRMERGDALVCVTDGILEWGDDAGAMFSDVGMSSVLSSRFESSQAILQAILDGLYSFHTPRFQRDDACAVALRRI